MCFVQPSFGSGIVRTPARKAPFALLDLSHKSLSNDTPVGYRSALGDSGDATFGEPVALCLFKLC